MADRIYAANLDIPAPLPIYGADRTPALRARRESIERLCERANVRYRVTGGHPPMVATWNRPRHGFVVNGSERIDVVGTVGLPQRDPERALRILEILAYGFNDYFARQSICGRGMFVWPIGPEHGRAWLAEIGRKGGQRSGGRKARASRRNGRHGGVATEAG